MHSRQSQQGKFVISSPYWVKLRQGKKNLKARVFFLIHPRVMRYKKAFPRSQFSYAIAKSGLLDNT